MKKRPLSSSQGHDPELSPAVNRMLATAGKALAERQPETAIRSLVGVLTLAPESVQVNRLMGMAHHMRQDHQQAVEYFQRALEKSPDDAMMHMALGITLYDQGHTDTAILSLERACELAPEMAACWFNLGKALKLQMHDTKRACQTLERALDIAPGHLSARITLADAQTSLGEITAAVRNYREILRRQPDHANAWLALANLKTLPFSARDVSELRKALQQARANSDARISLGFSLAKALEDQSDYVAAFKALGKANAAMHSTLSWDAGSEQEYVDAIVHAFETPVNAPSKANLGNEVIFVLGLPRSGSTLIEQILASHPEVEGAGEVSDLQRVIDEESTRRGQAFPQWVGSASEADWSRLGQDYLARTESWRQHKPRFTDKNLYNWHLVGAASAMLPGARFVNCRRDPVETCFAGYRQLFRSNNAFSYDLSDMVRYWKDYDRLCRYWLRLLPDHFIDQSHESLLAEPESEIRQLLDFCGLAFDPACLAFHETKRVVRTASAAQIRQPLRRDTARAPLYGSTLAPLHALLEDRDPPV